MHKMPEHRYMENKLYHPLQLGRLVSIGLGNDLSPFKCQVIFQTKDGSSQMHCILLSKW